MEISNVFSRMRKWGISLKLRLGDCIQTIYRLQQTSKEVGNLGHSTNSNGTARISAFKGAMKMMLHWVAYLFAAVIDRVRHVDVLCISL